MAVPLVTVADAPATATRRTRTPSRRDAWPTPLRLARAAAILSTHPPTSPPVAAARQTGRP